MKKCSKCEEVKELSEFYKHRRRKDGLSASCKICDKTYQAKYRKNNPTKIKEYQKEYREANKDRYKSYDKDDNRDYYRENRGAYNADCAKYQMSKLGLLPSDITPEDLSSIKAV